MNRAIGYMLENIVREDNKTKFSHPNAYPGAIQASPTGHPDTSEDYDNDWVRDSALTIIEIQALMDDGYIVDNYHEIISNYVSFVEKVQLFCKENNVELGWAKWSLNAEKVPDWNVQNDGPALRIIAIIGFLDELDNDRKEAAMNCIKTDAEYLCEVFQSKHKNIWEDNDGYHFFGRLAILKAFSFLKEKGIKLNNYDEKTLENNIKKLGKEIPGHWKEAGYYCSDIDGAGNGHDKNMSVVLGMLYAGGENNSFHLTSEKGMKTIKKIYDIYNGDIFNINDKDEKDGVGPNIGRYTTDNYDGDQKEPNYGHPWFLCTNAMATCFFLIANSAKKDKTVLKNAKSIFGTGNNTVQWLIETGDKMVGAVKKHWDNGHMSEQYHRDTGFMTIIKELTWSYSSFLMAGRWYHKAIEKKY